MVKNSEKAKKLVHSFSGVVCSGPYETSNAPKNKFKNPQISGQSINYTFPNPYSSPQKESNKKDR